jgi:hypothetical protein
MIRKGDLTEEEAMLYVRLGSRHGVATSLSSPSAVRFKF